MPSELFRVRLDEAIAEVERELNLRATFYPERVAQKRMPWVRANSQMKRLEAALGFLNELRELKGGNHEHDDR